VEDNERITAADWAHRSPEFEDVAAFDDDRPIVVMQFAPQIPSSSQAWLAWDQLRGLWLDLPPHPNLLDAIERCGNGLSLRYAALDWKFVPPLDDGSDPVTTTLATWGVQLCRAFGAIASSVPERSRGPLTYPFTAVDLDGHVRVGFRPVLIEDEAAQLPTPEAAKRWPHADERAFVYVVGGLLSDLSVPSEDVTTMGAIIARCLEIRPRRRYATLDELYEALITAGASVVAVRRSRRLAAWNLTEEGVGWLSLGQASIALDRFEQALALDPDSSVAHSGCRVAAPNARSYGPVAQITLRIPQPMPRMNRKDRLELHRQYATLRPWSEVEPEATALEAKREFVQALALYRVVMGAERRVAVTTAMARCHLQLREAGHAIDFAQRTLTADPVNVEALSIKTRALFLLAKHPLALECADAWIALAPSDGTAHYARGKSLFALGRFVEARACFDRACLLRPTMVEAMLLRREADRALGGVRDAVGEQPPMIDLPEHLAGLRGAPILEVIATLQRPVHAADPIAQLILGRCLLLEGRFDDAIRCYDVAVGSADHRVEALVGKAAALLELDRAAESLQLFDLVLRETPDDLDVIDGRARALARLGRNDEAERDRVWVR
jgi:tetratricopeptide (TPR) repeat protein